MWLARTEQSIPLGCPIVIVAVLWYEPGLLGLNARTPPLASTEEFHKVPDATAASRFRGLGLGLRQSLNVVLGIRAQGAL